MKPFLAVSALALVGLAGCTAADTADKSPKPNPSAADAALSSDTRAICQQADRTSASFGDTLTADLKLRLDAKGRGAPARAEAEQKLTQDVTNYSYALNDMSKLAGDATLKSTLKQMSDQVKAFSGDTSKINAARLSELSDTLGKACGRG
jgi:hypothetical protein